MGASQGKNINPDDYTVVSDDGEDIDLSVEEDVVEHEETPVEVEEEKAPEVQEPKKKKRRGRRGKKVVLAPQSEVKNVVEPEPEPETEPEVVEKVKTESIPIVRTIEEAPVVLPKKKKMKAEPKAAPIAKAEPKPKSKAELHEEAKKQQITLNRMSSIKETDRTCFACNKICESRYQLNHHYGICAAFPAAYEKLPTAERSWYMIIQYVRNDLAKASRTCLGCSSLFQTRQKLLEHNVSCEKAMTIDTWDRITCFGLLYGTPYDDFEKFRPKYKEPKKVPDYVKRVHDFVESLKKTILREKAEARLADERMKVVEEENIQKYIKEKLKGGGEWTAKQADAKQAESKQAEVKQAELVVETKEEKEEPPVSEPLSQRPKKERKKKEKSAPSSSAEPEQKAEPAIPSEYIETCNCEHCDLVRTYPPLENPALRGAEREGYYIIPMVMDGYSTVVNSRRIYVPTQNVLLRIHDLGSA